MTLLTLSSLLLKIQTTPLRKGGEEAKSEQEPLKIWGEVKDGKIVCAKEPAIRWVSWYDCLIIRVKVKPFLASLFLRCVLEHILLCTCINMLLFLRILTSAALSVYVWQCQTGTWLACMLSARRNLMKMVSCREGLVPFDFHEE